MSLGRIPSNRRLAGNVIINAAGFLITAAVLFLAYPQLLLQLGEKRIGVYLLLLTVVGYFSIFDLGINKALTRILAIHFSKEEAAEARKTLLNGLLLLGALGVIVTLIILLLAPVLVDSADPDFYEEAVVAIRIIAPTLIVLLLNSGLRSVFEAQQRFLTLNLISIPASAFNYLGPLVLSFFSTSLIDLAIVMLCGRLVVFFVMGLLISTQRESVFAWQKPDSLIIKQLAKYGGWLTVSRLINPIFLYFDRFLISATISMAAVTYYTTPFEISSRMLILAQTLITVLFPALSTLAGTDPERMQNIRNSSLKLGVSAIALAAGVVIIFAHPFFRWWVENESVIQQSPLILQILVIGIVVNYAAHFPATVLQAINRPDVSAKLHILEVPVYLLAAIFAIGNFGILGAALVWTGRALFDAALHFYFSEKLFPTTNKRELARHGFMIVATLLFFGGCFALSNMAISGEPILIYSIVLILIFSSFSWLFILTTRERRFIIDLIQMKR
jgi:O-antigen/teichoic acid export membrane protein